MTVRRPFEGIRTNSTGCIPKGETLSTCQLLWKYQTIWKKYQEGQQVVSALFKNLKPRVRYGSIATGNKLKRNFAPVTKSVCYSVSVAIA